MSWFRSSMNSILYSYSFDCKCKCVSSRLPDFYQDFNFPQLSPIFWIFFQSPSSSFKFMLFQPKFDFLASSSRQVLMNPSPSVSQSVSQSVCNRSSHTCRHRIFLIFCNKLALNECKKVTKPDFWEKKSSGQKWAN